MLKSLKAIEFIEGWLIHKEFVLSPDSDQDQASRVYSLLKKRFWDAIPIEDKEVLSILSVVAQVSPRLEEPFCENIFGDWTRKRKLLENYMDLIVRKEEEYSIISYQILDTYRDFIINELTDQQKQEINGGLAAFYKMYPRIGIRHFIQAADLEGIKDLYESALKEMEERYRYEDITDVCKSINGLIARLQHKDFKFHYEILRALGHARYSLGYFEESITYYERAKEIAVTNRWAESDPFGWVGVAYFNIGRFDDAINYLQKALSIAEIFDKNKNVEGFWLGCLANALRDSRLSETKELVVRLYDHALGIAGNDDRENKSRWLMNKGNLFLDIGQHRDAMTCYEEALIIAEECGYRSLVGRCLNNMGNAHATVGEIDKAITSYEKAASVSYDIGDHYNENICRGNLANKYWIKGRLPEAMDQYKRAIEITIDCKDMTRAEGHIRGLIAICNDNAKLEEIAEYFKERLGAARNRENREEEVFWLIYLGYLAQNLARIKEATDYYSEALEVASNIKADKYKRDVIGLLDSVSLMELEALYSSGQIDNALQKCNDLIVKIVGRNLGAVFQSISANQRNKYPLTDLDDRIKKYIVQIRDDYKIAQLHSSLADCYARKGELAEAILEYEKAIELDPSSTLTILSMMEVSLWRKQYEETLALYHQWKDRFSSASEQLIASWIVCTVLALTGRSYKDYAGILTDEIDASDTNYGYDDIVLYFSKLLEEGHNMKCLVDAWQLHLLFKNHFDVNPLMDSPRLPKALKGLLIGVLKTVVPSSVSPIIISAFMKRGLIYRMRGELDMAIRDYVTVTIFDQSNDEAYMTWGACLSQKGQIENAISKYDLSIGFNPTNNMAFLAKMEAEICLGAYKTVINMYRKLSKRVLTPKEELIAASLASISLALEGKSFGKLTNRLADMSVKLSGRQDWCTVEIDRYLSEIDDKLVGPDKVNRAKDIQELFKRHFET